MNFILMVKFNVQASCPILYCAFVYIESLDGETEKDFFFFGGGGGGEGRESNLSFYEVLHTFCQLYDKIFYH